MAGENAVAGNTSRSVSLPDVRDLPGDLTTTDSAGKLSDGSKSYSIAKESYATSSLASVMHSVLTSRITLAVDDVMKGISPFSPLAEAIAPSADAIATKAGEAFMTTQVGKAFKRMMTEPIPAIPKAVPVSPAPSASSEATEDANRAWFGSHSIAWEPYATSSLASVLHSVLASRPISAAAGMVSHMNQLNPLAPLAQAIGTKAGEAFMTTQVGKAFEKMMTEPIPTIPKAVPVSPAPSASSQSTDSNSTSPLASALRFVLSMARRAYSVLNNYRA
jgi:hypothetical protein